MTDCEHVKSNLSNLNGKKAGAFDIEISASREQESPDMIVFNLFLRHASGQKAIEPVAVITYKAGKATADGRFEIDYAPFVVFEGTAIEKQRIAIPGTEHELELFRRFLDVASPGDPFHIRYEMKKKYLPAKLQDKDATRVLSALLDEAGFADKKRVDRVNIDRDERSAGEIAIFTAKKSLLS